MRYDGPVVFGGVHEASNATHRGYFAWWSRGTRDDSPAYGDYGRTTDEAIANAKERTRTGGPMTGAMEAK